MFVAPVAVVELLRVDDVVVPEIADDGIEAPPLPPCPDVPGPVTFVSGCSGTAAKSVPHEATKPATKKKTENFAGRQRGQRK